jgi:flagellar motor switch protein FliN
MNYIDCWISVATTLLSQALAGEPRLIAAPVQPFERGAFGFAAKVKGNRDGWFRVLLDSTILQACLLADTKDQKEAWSELLREIADAAAGELFAKSGEKCNVTELIELHGEIRPTHAFQLQSANETWMIYVEDEVRVPGSSMPVRGESTQEVAAEPARQAPLSAGAELLLDVELEASLRFGCREISLGEVLELGPGDVVELDRQVVDPVDLIVGDKIVARGEVVLVDGNFGLRVTEVATPRKRLETIRCLF